MSASRISRGVPASKARGHCVALSQWNLRNDRTTQPVLKVRRSSPEFREGSMSSKMQTRNLHGNKKTEQKSGLSRHYHEIGIKAVAAATRKESSASPRTRDSMAINR